MKWFKIVYINEYKQERSHTFSGNMGTVRMVMEAYRIDLDSVLTFTINDEQLDIATYLGGDE